MYGDGSRLIVYRSGGEVMVVMQGPEQIKRKKI